MRLRGAAALLVGVGALMGTVVLPATAAGGEQPPAVAPGTTGTVTLVTGDVIGYRQSGPTVQVTDSRPGTDRREVTRRLDDQLFGFTDPTTGLSGATDRELVFPQTRIEYYTPGVTWHPAAVTHRAAGTLSVRLPAGGTAGGHASLRATARAASGDTVSERIMAAYALR